MELEIYDNFVLQGVITTFVSLTWKRKFSICGDAELTLPFDIKKDLYKLDLLKIGNVIYKRNTQEAVIIEAHAITQGKGSSLNLNITGRKLTSILDRRIFTLDGDIELNQFLTNVINENFKTLGNRNIPNLRLMPFSLPTSQIKATYKQANVLQSLELVMQQQQTGFKILYNLDLKTYDLYFYNKKQTDVVFSPDLGNILQQDYIDSEMQYKNVVYIGADYIYNDSITGLERREISATAKSGETESQYLDQVAKDTLTENKKINTLASEIDPTAPQFDYLVDWDLGSIVTSQNRFLNYSKEETIIEITEVYAESGMRLEVTFGDYIKK